MLYKVDVWIGKTMFHPPIIWICRLTHQSQYSFSKLVWFAASLYMFHISKGIWWNIFYGCLAVSTMLLAALVPDRPTKSYLLVRLFLLGMMIGAIFEISRGASSDWKDAAIVNFSVLFAEYALTLKAIPPKKKRDRKTSRKIIEA